MSFIGSIIKPLAYISLPLLVARQIAVNPNPSPYRYFARAFLYVGTLMTVASCSIIAAAGMSLIGRSSDVNNLVAKMFYGAASRLLDLKIEVEGEELLETRPAVLMANHQSMIDVLVIGRIMPKQTSIMAKKSLQFTPLGPFMSLSGAIFVNRGNNASAIRSIEAAGEKMNAERISLWMFPEGTRHMSKEPDMLPLKKGGFHLAINAGIPILPIVVENYWHMYRKGVFETGTIKVKVLPPVPTDGLTVKDVHHLAESVRESMLTTMREISVKSPSTSTPSKDALREKTPTASSPSDSSSALHTSQPSHKLDNPPALNTLVESVAPFVSATIGVLPDTVDSAISSKGSSSSLSSSSFSSAQRRDSETGAETEEDEGMVLVGRPTSP